MIEPRISRMMDVIANTVSVDEYGDISLRDVQKAAEAAYAVLDAAMEGQR